MELRGVHEENYFLAAAVKVYEMGVMRFEKKVEKDERNGMTLL